MKKLLIAVGMMLSLATTATADHASENADQIARLAYQLADQSEYLEREIRGEIWGGFGDRRGGHMDAFDHRRDSLTSLMRRASRLHHTTSDLYYSARDQGRGQPDYPRYPRYPRHPGDRHLVNDNLDQSEQMDLFDHRGDNIRRAFSIVSRDYDQLMRTYRSSQRYCSYRINNRVRWIQQAYSRLRWYVYGR